MAGRDGVADPAFELDAEPEGEQQLGAAHASQLGQREQRRRHRRGRMNDGRKMGVAEIEHVGAGRVQKGRAQGIRALAAADDGRLPAIGKLGQRLEGNLHRAGAAAGQRDREEIEQRAPGLVAGRLGNVAPAGLDQEASKVLGNARSMQHCVGSGWLPRQCIAIAYGLSSSHG
jgi:hypothetical protein